MDAIELKKKIRDYLENPDERILEIFNAIIEPDAGKLSDTHKIELNKRLQDYLENPEDVLDWQDVKN